MLLERPPSLKWCSKQFCCNWPVPRARFPLLVPCFSRNLSIGRRDESENVASKMSLRSFVPHRDYSNFVKFRQTLPCKPCIQVWRENKISSSLVHVLRKKYSQAISRGSRLTFSLPSRRRIAKSIVIFHENFPLKVNSHSFNLHRDYSNSPTVTLMRTFLEWNS